MFANCFNRLWDLLICLPSVILYQMLWWGKLNILIDQELFADAVYIYKNIMYSCTCNNFICHLCDPSLQKMLLNSLCLNLFSTQNITFLQNHFSQTFLAIKLGFVWILHSLTTWSLSVSQWQCPMQCWSEPWWAGSLSGPCVYTTHNDDWTHTILKNFLVIKADLGPSVYSSFLLSLNLVMSGIDPSLYSH